MNPKYLLAVLSFCSFCINDECFISDFVGHRRRKQMTQRLVDQGQLGGVGFVEVAALDQLGSGALGGVGFAGRMEPQHHALHRALRLCQRHLLEPSMAGLLHGHSSRHAWHQHAPRHQRARASST